MQAHMAVKLKPDVLMPLALGACVAFTLVPIWAPVAHAWETGVETDVPLECKVSLGDASESLAVRMSPDDGSVGVPFLVGLKDGQTLWRLRFPADKINAAKSYVVCKGRRGGKGQVIDIASQDPASTQWRVQRFRWDGGKIKKLGAWVR